MRPAFLQNTRQSARSLQSNPKDQKGRLLYDYCTECFTYSLTSNLLLTRKLSGEDVAEFNSMTNAFGSLYVQLITSVLLKSRKENNYESYLLGNA
jgi:hypothetical protein